MNCGVNENLIGMLPGKLDLYVGAAGFHPGKVLPCVIDIGTDNTDLQNNDLYMGAPSLECLQDNNVQTTPLLPLWLQNNDLYMGAPTGIVPQRLPSAPCVHELFVCCLPRCCWDNTEGLCKLHLEFPVAGCRSRECAAADEYDQAQREAVWLQGCTSRASKIRRCTLSCWTRCGPTCGAISHPAADLLCHRATLPQTHCRREKCESGMDRTSTSRCIVRCSLCER